MRNETRKKFQPDTPSCFPAKANGNLEIHISTISTTIQKKKMVHIQDETWNGPTFFKKIIRLPIPHLTHIANSVPSCDMIRIVFSFTEKHSINGEYKIYTTVHQQPMCTYGCGLQNVPFLCHGFQIQSLKKIKWHAMVLV